jgi:hypothetical protein
MSANEKSSSTNIRRKRIQKVSGLVRAFFLAILILEIVGIVAGTIALPFILLHGGALKSQIAFKNCYSFLVLPFALMVTFNFFRLFSRLKEGHLFKAQTVKYLETAGKWWIALGIVQAIFQFAEGYIFTPSNIIVSGSNGIFAGLVVFFVAWVLREAQELQEEQELTV